MTAPRMKRYGVWNIKSKDWIYSQPKWNNWKPTTCTFKTKRDAARCIKSDLVHEKDYEIRELP